MTGLVPSTCVMRTAIGRVEQTPAEDLFAIVRDLTAAENLLDRLESAGARVAGVEFIPDDRVRVTWNWN